MKEENSGTAEFIGRSFTYSIPQDETDGVRSGSCWVDSDIRLDFREPPGRIPVGLGGLGDSTRAARDARRREAKRRRQRRRAFTYGLFSGAGAVGALRATIRRLRK